MVLPSAGARRPRGDRAARRDARVPLSLSAARRRARVRRPAVGRAQRFRGPRRRAVGPARACGHRRARERRGAAARGRRLYRRAVEFPSRAREAGAPRTPTRRRRHCGHGSGVDRPARRPAASARLAEARAQVVADAARRGGRSSRFAGRIHGSAGRRSLRDLARVEPLDRPSCGVARGKARIGRRAAGDLDRHAGLPARSKMARPGDRKRRGAGARAMGALHRRRCERRRRADPPPRFARRARSTDQGRPPRRERQHQPGDELGRGARDGRFPAVSRPGRRARTRRARRDRARPRCDTRRRPPLHRRRQDRHRRRPLRPAVQAGMVAGAPAVVHVLFPRVRRAAGALRRARRIPRRVRGLAGLRLCAPRERARTRHRSRSARALSLARDAGLDGDLRFCEAFELRGRATGDRRGPRAAGKPRPRRAAGMGGAARASASSPTSFPTTARASRS